MNAIKKIFKDNLGLLLVSGFILIALMIVYNETLDGSKSFYGANDKVSAVNVKKAISESEEYPYWFPWMMGGVPSVHSAQNISDYYPPNYVMRALHWLGVPWFWNYILHFLFAGIGMYLLCSRLKLNMLASSLSSLGFAITPYMTGMLVYGHGSQVMTLCYMPWIFYSYVKLKDSPTIKGLAFLALFLALQLLRGHVQMAYYTWLMLGVLILIDVIYTFIVRKQKKLKWIFYTILALSLGFISSLSLYVPMLSYTSFSTRSSKGTDAAVSGIDWATEYSFSFGEIATFFIPSYYGFGGTTYWGTMTFTSFPHYMSVIMLIFAIYGLIRYQWTRFKVFTIFCIIFFLVLSFGKNFISFYTLFYDYLPFFSKFRNPAYLLIIIQFCTMLLSGMGLTMILKDIKDRKIVLPVYSFCTIILLCLLPMIIDFGTSDGDRLIYNKDRQRNFSILESTRLYEISQIEEREKRFLNNIESQRTEFIRSNPMATFQDLQSLNDEAEQLKANLRGEKEFFIANLDTQINDAKNQAESFYKNRLDLSESLVESDIRVMQIFVFLAFSLIILVYCVQPFLSDFKYSNQILISFIALLVFFDFYLVDRRVTNPEKSEYLWSEDARLKYDKLYSSSDGNTIEPLIKAKAETDLFKDQDGLKNLIKSKEKGEIFRIIDTRGGGFSHSNYWAQHHIEDINGYHPAKLKSYNDFIGRVRDRGFSPYILEMLNVRYILNDDRIDTMASERAYFVNKVMIDYEKDIDKRYEDLYFYFKEDPYPIYPSVSDGVYITSGSLETDWEDSSDKEGTLECNFKIIEGEDIINSIDNSNPNELILEVSTTGPQFLAISEVFYPNGWKATINGQETAIYEVNELIRGVSIKGEGQHTIRMWFDPADLKWGRVLSYVGFLIIFIFILSDHIQKAITIIYKSKTS